MTTTTEIRTCAASANLLAEAEILLRAGAMRQASGKAWQAVEHRLYEIMRERDWDRSEAGDHDEMGYLCRFASLLAKESDDPGEVNGLLLGAVANYTESLVDWHDALTVRVGIDEAGKFIAALERIAKPCNCEFETLTATTEIRARSASAVLLAEADTLLRAGAMRQASGKAWQAVEHRLYEIMRERDWDRSEVGDHDEMGYLCRFASLLAKESDDPWESQGLLLGAFSNYADSLQDGNPELLVRVGIDEAGKFIAALERIAKPRGHG